MWYHGHHEICKKKKTTNKRPRIKGYQNRLSKNSKKPQTVNKKRSWKTTERMAGELGVYINRNSLNIIINKREEKQVQAFIKDEEKEEEDSYTSFQMRK